MPLQPQAHAPYQPLANGKRGKRMENTNSSNIRMTIALMRRSFVSFDMAYSASGSSRP